MMNKKAQMPEFNWIFVIIVGAVILFLAVMFSGKLIKTSTYQQSAELLPAFDVLLNPFSSVGNLVKTIRLQNEVIVEINCSRNNENLLGSEKIRTKSKGAFGKWSEFTDFPYAFYDKYVFADQLEGKTFYVFSKPFEMPFKIDEMIYMTYENYCFVNAPADIEQELTAIELETLKVGECSENDKRVCFGGATGCEITVIGDDANYNTGHVEKTEKNVEKRLYFASKSLMYGAIFASSSNYNCNFARLMERLKQLTSIYKRKADTLTIKGCNMMAISGLIEKLGSKANIVKGPGADKKTLYDAAQELENLNVAITCPVF